MNLFIEVAASSSWFATLCECQKKQSGLILLPLQIRFQIEKILLNFVISGDQQFCYVGEMHNLCDDALLMKLSNQGSRDEIPRRASFGDAHTYTRGVAASRFKVVADDVCQHHNARQLTY